MTQLPQILDSRFSFLIHYAVLAIHGHVAGVCIHEISSNLRLVLESTLSKNSGSELRTMNITLGGSDG
jgi:hypothetical protein